MLFNIFFFVRKDKIIFLKMLGCVKNEIILWLICYVVVEKILCYDFGVFLGCFW